MPRGLPRGFFTAAEFSQFGQFGQKGRGGYFPDSFHLLQAFALPLERVVIGNLFFDHFFDLFHLRLELLDQARAHFPDHRVPALGQSLLLRREDDHQLLAALHQRGQPLPLRRRRLQHLGS